MIPRRGHQHGIPAPSTNPGAPKITHGNATAGDELVAAHGAVDAAAAKGILGVGNVGVEEGVSGRVAAQAEVAVGEDDALEGGAVDVLEEGLGDERVVEVVGEAELLDVGEVELANDEDLELGGEVGDVERGGSSLGGASRIPGVRVKTESGSVFL